MTMDRAGLHRAIQIGTGESEATVEKVMTAFYKGVVMTIVTGERVHIRGFGAFTLVKRAARRGKHPQTGADIKIKAASSMRFLAAKDVKAAVNGGKK